MSKDSNWRYQQRLLSLWPTRNLTAAEEMLGELGPQQVSKNLAAGPTYSEVWWREWENELEERLS